MSPWCTNTKELFDIILAASKDEDFTWSWARTSGFKCKYINIRIDMRDGGFILTNRADERITAQELWEQGLKKDEEITPPQEESLKK